MMEFVKVFIEKLNVIIKTFYHHGSIVPVAYYDHYDFKIPHHIVLHPICHYSGTDIPQCIGNHPIINTIYIGKQIASAILEFKDEMIKEFNQRFPDGEILFEIDMKPIGEYMKMEFKIRMKEKNDMYWAK